MSIEKSEKYREKKPEKDILKDHVLISNQWDPLLRKVDREEDGGGGERPSENKSKWMCG